MTGVRNGGCKYYDTCYFAEIAALFHNTAHTQVNFRTLARGLSTVCSGIVEQTKFLMKVKLYDAGYKTITKKDCQARQVAFQVEVSRLI